MVAIEGSRVYRGEEAKAVVLEASRAFREKQLSRITRRAARLPDAPDRRSVAEAMLAVEIRLVKAFWTIARQPLGGARPLLIDEDGDIRLGKQGVEYVHEEDKDRHAGYQDAPGGDWTSTAPRGSLPSSKEIDDANTALDWLLLIDDETLRKLLVVGATNKRGDAGRQISWIRVRTTMPELVGYTTRALKYKYREALRIIVHELTMARFAA